MPNHQQSFTPTIQKSFTQQKIVAYLRMAQENESLWNAILVSLGALFLLSSIPFYPSYSVPFLAIACGVIAFKYPPGGILLSSLLAFPAVAYQSAIFGWLYLIILAAILFEIYDNWAVIAVLKILILAPFSFGGLIFGWITILGMALGTFHFGSKKSLMIAVPAVFIILLLSSLWLKDTVYFPIVMKIHEPGNPDLLFEKPEVIPTELINKAIDSISSLLSTDNTRKLMPAIEKLFGSIFNVLFSDSGLIQLIVWTAALYAMGQLSGIIKKHSALISSFVLLFVAIAYFGISALLGTVFRYELVAAIVGSIAIIGCLEQFGIKISRESEVQRGEQLKSFGKFGIQDIGLAKGEKGLDSVGGYEDVKQELRDAILLPLEKKDIAYMYGIKPPTGILLFGPPGTGKTMLMRALAAELKYGFYYVKSSDLLSMWYGESLPYNEKIVILNESGRVCLREIGKVVEERQEVRVLSFDQHRNTVFADIKDWIKHRCTSPIYEVRTKTGRRIRVTDYHSLFTWDGNKIVSIATNKIIPKKSYIAVPYKIEFDGSDVSEQEFLTSLKNNGSAENKLLVHANGDIYLDRVEEIKRVDDEKYVYDISVNPCQNFVGGFGGIFAHNSEKNVAELFSIARTNAPCILFFDEVDAIGKKRSGFSTDDVAPRVLTTLLQEMDGMPKSAKKPVMVVAATNMPHQLDPALLRPGRIDKIIYMHLPDLEARKAIFKVSLKRTPLAENVDFDRLAAKTERFSGADIKNITQEAIKLAAKEAITTNSIVPISMDHLMKVINVTKPSTSLALIDDHEQFRLDFERRIGGKEEKKKDEVTKWEDIVGLDDVKKTLLETIQLPLLHEDLMKEFKVKPTKGILLFGPPGTGKTLIVKAASNELKVSFQTLSGAELMKQGYTQAVNVIKEVFNRGRENTPAIIFVDEIETFAPARGIGSSEIVGQFLSEMDGLKELKGVVVIAATNRPAILDPAILRPGRFDKIFFIPSPTEKGRVEMFKLYLGKFAEGIDLVEVAKRTAGFSGADIAAICQEVKMEALRARLEGKESKVEEQRLLKIISKRRPSISKELLGEYDEFLVKYGERR